MRSQFKKGSYTLTQKEVKLIIISEMNFRNRTLLKTLYYGGLRREEVQQLRIADIDFNRQMLYVRGKGDKERVVPFIDLEFMGDLKQLITGRRDGHVFVKDNGKPMSTRMINLITEKAGKVSGIRNPDPKAKTINPHLFRHSIARHLKNQNYPLDFVQNFLGHSSFKTTMDHYGTLGVNEMLDYARSRIGLGEDNQNYIK